LEKIAALYLAHLNPVTKAHERIITNLAKQYNNVYVYPVIFFKGGNEINTRTFPFSYEIRKTMLGRLFDKFDNIKVLPDYSFVSPYIRYLPFFLSPYSWTLRKQILGNVKEREFISYTGDTAERIALRMYNLHPIKSRRLEISASKVKELMYDEALSKMGRSTKQTQTSLLWSDLVPERVVDVIKQSWHIIEQFAQMPDRTVKIIGMKFPADGIVHF
jgi:hypothetical protein